jgi:uncharacterized protein with ATP-grasp and redox domains
MFIWPDCIPCILNMSLKIARFVMKEENQVRRFMNEILAWRSLRGEGWHVRSPEIVRDVWIKLQEFSGYQDLLKGLKEEQNRKALKIFPLAKDIVLKSHDPFLEALKFAIAGNALDSMIGEEGDLTQKVMGKLDKSVISLESADRLRERLQKSHRLVYLSDNCGEIVFDRLLIEVIKGTFETKIILVTRTLPVLNDATLRDAYSVGLGEVVPLIENGIPEPFPSTTLKKVSHEAREAMKESDLLISKGAGNHDTLTEEESLRGKVSFLLHGKCHPCCTFHKVPLGSLIVYNF